MKLDEVKCVYGFVNDNGNSSQNKTCLFHITFEKYIKNYYFICKSICGNLITIDFYLTSPYYKHQTNILST